MSDSAVLRRLAVQMEERGAWPEAIELRAEVAADPYSNFWDDFFYARAVLYAGRHADAEPLIIELARESNKGPVWMLKTDLFECTEKFEDALKAWEQAGKTGGLTGVCLGKPALFINSTDLLTPKR